MHNKILPCLMLLTILVVGCSRAAPPATPGGISIGLAPETAAEETPVQKTFLALGDSYTIGESVAVEARWPVQLADALRKAGIAVADPVIVAKTGWTTAELEAGIAAASLEPPYDLVTLLIGVNNQYRGYAQNEYRAEFRRLLEQAITFASGQANHVIVLSIPDWGMTPFARNDSRGPETITAEIQAFNRINAEESLAAGVRYVDIFPASQRGYDFPDFIANDGLHPSGIQYAAWVEAVLPAALEVLR